MRRLRRLLGDLSNTIDAVACAHAVVAKGASLDVLEHARCELRTTTENIGDAVAAVLAEGEPR